MSNYKTASTGSIYILSNPAMPGLYKIGMTTRSVVSRIAELNSSTSLPLAFVVEKSMVVSYPWALEQKIHKVLSKYRVNGNREFFQIELDELKAILLNEVAEVRAIAKKRGVSVVVDSLVLWAVGCVVGYAAFNWGMEGDGGMVGVWLGVGCIVGVISNMHGMFKKVRGLGK